MTELPTFGLEALAGPINDPTIALIIIFVLNMLPFAGPSNLLIANLLGAFSVLDPILIGFLVAFGATSAKTTHYFSMFFVRGVLNPQRIQRIEKYGAKFTRWGPLAIFLVAATPIPDEPIILPFGLMKYNPLKFYGSYFLGKLTIAIPGAFLGRFSGEVIASIFGTEVLIVVSIVLTVVVTIALLKDPDRILKFFRRKFRSTA